MARQLSVIVMMAIALFLCISFFTSFGRAPAETAVFSQPADRFNDNLPPSDVKPPVKPVEAVEPASRPAEPVKPVKPVLEGSTESKLAGLEITSDLLTGAAIAPKLENATLKAELGRAAWKVLHTMMAKFPDEPSEDDQLALKSYIQLFARLYPCGDCARHFQGLLKQYPPQVSSRNAAAGWACFVHNQVNERLEHEIFDCNKIGDFYDCGCGDDKEKKGDEEKTTATGELKKEG
ncbi:hypothetical protein PFICI_02049 [Pestalotiopsis fici W106-1]|uniref:Sulfhydryl oxidase n=1 Tax=Pestalotiopsis fici (strain W106-1 / CGMCC3.15140) TaxID=1229662 RepID=W3XSQ1_PESFW|nr:uncharacterized protein PFICI_02049 [Pestalotiopsis fici W106-1]ETS88221.1 hypothetical protein PFICI_02049 [Pestalotiopsis fici W106-1]